MTRFIISSCLAVFVGGPLFVVVALAAIAAIGAGETVTVGKISIRYFDSADQHQVELLASELASKRLYGSYERSRLFEFSEKNDKVQLTLPDVYEKPTAEQIGSFQMVATIVSQHSLAGKPVEFLLKVDGVASYLRIESRTDFGKYWTDDRDQIFFPADMEQTQIDDYLKSLKEIGMASGNHPVVLQLELTDEVAVLNMLGDAKQLAETDPAELDQTGKGMANILKTNLFAGQDTVFCFTNEGFEPLPGLTWTADSQVVAAE